VSDSSYAYASGRVSGLEDSLVSRRVWHQLLAAEDRADVLRVLGETWYAPLLQGEGSLEKALRTAVSRAEDELRDLSRSEEFTRGILQRRDVRNARYVWKSLAAGGSGEVDTEPPGTIPVENLLRAWGDSAEAESLPVSFRNCLERIQEMSRPSAAELDAELDRLAADVESRNLGGMDEPLNRLPKVKIELRNFLSAARSREEGISPAVLEGMLLEGGYHTPGEVSEAFRSRKLPEVLAETAGFQDASKALEEGLEGGSFLGYQRETDILILDILETASANMFSPGPLAAYVLHRELEVSHLKLVTAGKSAGMDSRRLRARIPRG